VPACLNLKLHTTAGNPKDAAYPAQMLKLRRTHEFPEVACIGRYEAICAYGPRGGRPGAEVASLAEEVSKASAGEASGESSTPHAAWSAPEISLAERSSAWPRWSHSAQDPALPDQLNQSNVWLRVLRSGHAGRPIQREQRVGPASNLRPNRAGGGTDARSRRAVIRTPCCTSTRIRP
jgi:hypothetical protein